jgi:hypothetical protein
MRCLIPRRARLEHKLSRPSVRGRPAALHSGRSLTLVVQDHISVSSAGLLLGMPIWLIAPGRLVVMSLHAVAAALAAITHHQGAPALQATRPLDLYRPAVPWTENLRHGLPVTAGRDHREAKPMAGHAVSDRERCLP